MTNELTNKEAGREFVHLLEIMDRLRSECPWDKKQNNESLRTLTIEETFELSDAILKRQPLEIRNELGDIMLHIVFYAKIGNEQADFSIVDVLQGICKKLIFRHPHIFGNATVKDEDEVKQNWEKLKLKEGRTSVLEGVPKGLTGLLKAYRLQEKAAGVGFDWQVQDDVWSKVKEELEEWKEAISLRNEEKIEEELGDLLFSIVNYTRFMKLNPEDALERANHKFISRFQFIEKSAHERGKSLSEMSLEQMEVLWQESKKKGQI